MSTVRVQLLAAPLLLFIVGALAGFQQEIDWPIANYFYEFSARDLAGAEVQLDKYRGRVLLVLNGATRCPVSLKAFRLLQKLQDRYAGEGSFEAVAFVVDGLVGSSGSTQDIRAFVEKNGFTFDVYDKIANDGEDAHPVYKWMSTKLFGMPEKIPVSSKILIDKNGKVLAILPPKCSFEELEEAVKPYM